MKTMFEWAVGLFVLFCFIVGFLDLGETRGRSVRENRPNGTPRKKIGGTSKLTQRTTLSRTSVIITMREKGEA